MKIKGKIISGDFDRILVRKKSDEKIELGEILICEQAREKILLQSFDSSYGSQIEQKNIELASGLSLEKNSNLEFIESELRNYNITALKPLLCISDNNISSCKTLPEFFSDVREIEESDLNFLSRPNNPLFLGNLRSGSRVFNTEIFVDGVEVLTHHILIPATTGRGKSNLVKCILWDLTGKDYCSVLVLDPHDEYYGRNGFGLKDHPQRNKIYYYTTKNPLPGSQTLKINIKHLKPWHFNGVILLSDPQQQAMYLYYQRFGENWIRKILEQTLIEGVKFDQATLDVLKRKLLTLLGLEEKISNQGREFLSYSVFDFEFGQNTIPEIINHLESSSIVIIDTSSLVGNIEVLIGSVISSEILRKYQLMKMSGQLNNKPVVSIVLEEAPRVLSNEDSVFSTIAREGRKFKIGLIAITQLPSLIPRQILANMNTKIILGIEMAPERQAIIDSASQDLSDFSRNIAALDKGEAIITSNFTKFAVPVKIPLFEDYAKNRRNTKKLYNVKIEGMG